MKLEICTQSSQLAAAMPTQMGATPLKLWKLAKLRPIAEPKVKRTKERATASAVPAKIAGQST